MMKNQKKRSEKAPIQKFNLITGASELLLSVLCTVGFCALGAYLQKDIPGNFLCSADRAFRFCGDSLNTENKCVQKKV